jgi:hypothetical protein
VALFPAVTVVPVGVEAIEKSAKKTDSETVVVCWADVPVTVRFNGFALVGERPVTLSVLDCPAAIEEGVNVQVAPLLHDRAIGLVKVVGAAAETVKEAVEEPMMVVIDRALAESENSESPVPDRLSADVDTALDVIWTLPVTVPVLVGVKLTITVHACPTFKVAGTVGKFVPQLFVCANPPAAVMLVIVTTWLPLLTKTALCEWPVVFTVCAGNVNLEGVKSNDPPVVTLVPVSVTPCVTGPGSEMVNCSV